MEVANPLMDSSTAEPAPAPAAQEPRPASPKAASAVPLIEVVLVWCVVSLGAYLGALIRIGFQYYRGGGPAPAVFTVMYAQMLGCFVLGYASEFQAWCMAGPRLHRLLYIGVASGLCGSITTFSAWMFESARLGLVQLDMSYGSIGGTYHGGRFLEWALALWQGIVLPLAALHGGQHAAQVYLARAAQRSAEARLRAQALLPAGSPPLPPLPATAPPGLLRHWHAYAEAAVLALYCVATALVVALPVALGWHFIAWSCALGACGAYLRHQLAAWNKAPPAWPPLCCAPLHRALGSDRGCFPLGTFTANAIGSWVLAAALAASKLGTSYHDIPAQAALYGLATGFCGCLTTMSTFVLELNSLPRSAAYFYCLASLAVAQLGWAVLFTAEVGPVAQAQVSGAEAPLPLAPCVLYPALCSALLSAVQCPAAAQRVVGCVGGSSSSSAPSAANLGASACACGALDMGERLGELVIDVQTKGNISSSLVAVFPSLQDNPGGSTFGEPLESVDFCLSFENLCDHALARLSCPREQRSINACDRRGLAHFVGQCACGAFTLPGVGNGVDGRVPELLIDYLLLRRYDLRAIRGHPTGTFPIDYCAAVAQACASFLDHIMCPPAQRSILACATLGDLQTFEGQCTCFGRPGPASNRIPQTVLDAFFVPNWFPRLVHLPEAAALNSSLVDACASFAGICSFLLQGIGCPAQLHSVLACAPPSGAQVPPAGAAALASGFVGTCSCGEGSPTLNRLLSTRTREYVIDGILAEPLEAYVLTPPPQPPFLLMAASTPFRQLLAPLQPLPGSNE